MLVRMVYAQCYLLALLALTAALSTAGTCVDTAANCMAYKSPLNCGPTPNATCLSNLCASKVAWAKGCQKTCSLCSGTCVDTAANCMAYKSPVNCGPTPNATCLSNLCATRVAWAKGCQKTCSKCGPTDVPTCLVMGQTGDIIPGKTIPTCEQFYPTGSPIRAPNDSDSTKFGIVLAPFFVDRTGKTWRIPQDMMPKFSSQVIVRATFVSGSVTAITVLLFIPTGTLLKPLRNTTFIGTLTTNGGPSGVSAESWIRWDFGSTIELDEGELALRGQVTNLFDAVRDAAGKCQSALCNLDAPNSPTCKWYTKGPFDNGKTMHIWWSSSSYRSPSRLMPYFSDGVFYPSSRTLPGCNELLATNVELGQPWTFIVTGSPQALYKFDGTFSKVAAPSFCN